MSLTISAEFTKSSVGDRNGGLSCLAFIGIRGDGAIIRPERQQGRQEGHYRGPGVVHELEDAEVER
jgi:hypothetical protein